jgi:hypothetical protein
LTFSSAGGGAFHDGCRGAFARYSRRVVRRRGLHFRFHLLGLRSRAGELVLDLLELPLQQFGLFLQQLGLAFELLDLLSVRDRLRRNRVGNQQPRAQKRAAPHEFSPVIHAPSPLDALIPR